MGMAEAQKALYQADCHSRRRGVAVRYHWGVRAQRVRAPARHGRCGHGHARGHASGVQGETPRTSNALAILLGRSRIPAVRTMTPARLNQLLLGRSTVAAIGAAEITLYQEPIHEYRDREHQRELVRVFDEAALTLTGRTLRLRLRKPRENG